MRILLFLLMFILLSCKSSDNLIHEKKIQTTSFKEDCSVVLGDVNAKDNKTYYWYKSNKIHFSKGGYSGNLLHNAYVKHYITNELQEKGSFHKGLKVKKWKTWFKNGNIQSVINYNKGTLNGTYTFYNDKGKIEYFGKYSNGKKVGKWINVQTKDTVFYKRGEILDKELQKNKLSFFKRIFTKKDSLVKKERKSQKKAKNAKS